MEKIAWITPDYFIETDAFIVPDLSEKYYIDWFVIYTGDINNISQKDKIDNIQDKKNLSVHFVKQTRESLFSLKNFKFYYNLIKAVKLTRPKIIYSAVLNFPYSILAFLYFHNLKKSLLPIAISIPFRYNYSRCNHPEQEKQ